MPDQTLLLLEKHAPPLSILSFFLYQDRLMHAGSNIRSTERQKLSTYLPTMKPANLEGFDEGPEQGADTLPFAEQFDQAHDAEKTEEGDGDTRAVL